MWQYLILLRSPPPLRSIRLMTLSAVDCAQYIKLDELLRCNSELSPCINSSRFCYIWGAESGVADDVTCWDEWMLTLQWNVVPFASSVRVQDGAWILRPRNPSKRREPTSQGQCFMSEGLWILDSGISKPVSKVYLTIGSSGVCNWLCEAASLENSSSSAVEEITNTLCKRSAGS